MFAQRHRAWLALTPLCVGLAVAQGPPAEPNPGEAGWQKIKQQMMSAIKKADRNQDGVLDKSEFITLERIARLPADKQDKLFERMDKNKDQLLQPNEFPPKGGDRDMVHRKIIPHLRELDLNHDMAISHEEFVQSPMIEKLPPERQEAIFKMMDRDGDGKLTPQDRPSGPPDEQGEDPQRHNNRKNKPGMPARDGDFDAPRGMPVNGAVIAKMDLNHDGNVDFAEFRQSPLVSRFDEDEQEDRFQQMDTNHDHHLSTEELTKGLRMMGKRPDPGAMPPPQSRQEKPKADAAEEMSKEEMNKEEMQDSTKPDQQ